ncbi:MULTISPECIES: hypothetical protein [unclassified Moorena]|nr:MULTISPECIES: hypothetical protein [unclassified Moorena]
MVESKDKFKLKIAISAFFILIFLFSIPDSRFPIPDSLIKNHYN